MNAKACATVGERMAALIFDKRAKGRPQRPVEAHLSEAELAAYLALAVEEGWKRGLAAGKGEPMPEGTATAHGRLVSLAPVRGGPRPEHVRAALETLNGTALVPPAGSGLPRISISCPQVNDKDGNSR